MTDVCGAKTRSGSPCQQVAGWGTDHVGTGRCKLHGGASTGRPIIHGKYSVTYKQTLMDKAEQFEQFRGDLTAELDLLRVMLQEFLNKLSAGARVGAAEIAVVRDMVEAIARTEERWVKIRKDTAFGAQEMQLFIAAMSATLQKYVPPDDLPDALNELRSLLANH